MVMMIPLVLLSVGALFAGLIFSRFFIGDLHEAFWLEAIYRGAENHIMHAMHDVPEWAAKLPTLLMALGFGLAYLFYIKRPDLPKELARTQEPLYLFLLNKWYFDEIYDFLFVRPSKALGRFLWKRGDGWLIDGFGPDGVSARVLDVTRNVVRLQTGYVYHYAFAMLIGIAALISWAMFAGV